MATERPLSPRTSTIDVLERVLDKGIVIETQIDISIAGIRLINVDARVLVSSFATYLRYADALAAAGTAVGPPPLGVRPAPAREARAPRRRRSARVTMVCDDGCAFSRRAPRAGQTAAAVACPYREGVKCVLKRAA
jgi:hypothetical protein